MEPTVFLLPNLKSNSPSLFLYFIRSKSVGIAHTQGEVIPQEPGISGTIAKTAYRTCHLKSSQYQD